jgi:hypothetical protein
MPDITRAVVGVVIGENVRIVMGGTIRVVVGGEAGVAVGAVRSVAGGARRVVGVTVGGVVTGGGTTVWAAGNTGAGFGLLTRVP